MSIKAVLFDLDGTLLPMDQDVFVKAYFKGLAKRLAPRGYEPDGLIRAIWGGTGAMIKNDGSKTNEKVFWDFFVSIYGEKALDDEPYFDEFYRTDFQSVKEVCGFNPLAAQTVRRLRERGVRVALATNPIFPAIATESRMRWAGLSPDDFEVYTTYENIGCSKPSLQYYRQVAQTIGVEPEQCVMVGNDVDDDMVAQQLGMKVFLLTDNLINKSGTDISLFPNGDFEALNSYLDKII
ncbi:MAG: HAD family hydrolase [Clostridia bacterium]|nr:HAD family hydrolase [Clostridia bacterium]